MEIKGVKACQCGRAHRVDIEYVVIKEGAVAEISYILSQHHLKKVLIVADSNTYEVAKSNLK